jgi:hypothetical protein
MSAIDASAVSALVNEAQTGSAFTGPHSESEVLYVFQPVTVTPARLLN